MKVNILGAVYSVYDRSEEEDKNLKDCDGYCDKTTKEIVIKKKSAECNLGNFDAYRKKVLRHEIIHAFLFESGLHENFEHSQWGHDETYVDWVAVQFPKMIAAFTEVDAL